MRGKSSCRRRVLDVFERDENAEQQSSAVFQREADENLFERQNRERWEALPFRIKWATMQVRQHAPSVDGVKRIVRHKSGTIALREIRRYQKSYENLIPKASFTRVVKEILANFHGYRINPEAILALQEASETYLCELFHGAKLSMVCNKRVTLLLRDLHLAMHLQGHDHAQKHELSGSLNYLSSETYGVCLPFNSKWFLNSVDEDGNT